MDDPTDFRRLSQPFDAFRDEIIVKRQKPFGEFRARGNYEPRRGERQPAVWNERYSTGSAGNHVLESLMGGMQHLELLTITLLLLSYLTIED